MNGQLKRAVTILLLLITFVTLTSATKSSLYTRTVIITKIYPHKLGYKVLYMTNKLENKEVYLPMELFKKADGSDIFYGYDKA